MTLQSTGTRLLLDPTKFCKSPEEYNIFRGVYQQGQCGINLPHLYSLINRNRNTAPKENNADYMRLYRFVTENKRIFIIRRYDNNLWIYPRHPGRGPERGPHRLRTAFLGPRPLARTGPPGQAPVGRCLLDPRVNRAIQRR